MTRESVETASSLSPSSIMGCCPICFDEYYEEEAEESGSDGPTDPTTGRGSGLLHDAESGQRRLSSSFSAGVVVAPNDDPGMADDDCSCLLDTACFGSSDDMEEGIRGDGTSASNAQHDLLVDSDELRRKEENRRTQRRRRLLRLRGRRITLDPCQHAYCAECLLSYFAQAIEVRRIPIPCPSVGSTHDCCQTVSLSSVLQVLEGDGNGNGENKQDECNDDDYSDDGDNDEEGGEEGDQRRRRKELVRKLLRWQRLHDDTTLRPCPYCDELIAEADLCCSSCGHDMPHGHPTTSDGSIEVQATEEWILRATKPCSHCGAPIHKESGCDHVVCSNCHDDMCYKCGSHLHLSGKTIRTCSHCQRSYVDHRHNREYRFRLLLLLPLLLPGWILYVLAMTVLAILTGCFCCFFWCGTMESNPRLEENPRRGDDEDDDVELGEEGAVIRPTDSTLTAATAATSHSTTGPTNFRSSHKATTASTPAPLAPGLGIRRTVGYILLPILVYLNDMGVNQCTRWIEELETTSAASVKSAAAATTETSPAAAPPPTSVEDAAYYHRGHGGVMTLQL